MPISGLHLAAQAGLGGLARQSQGGTFSTGEGFGSIGLFFLLGVVAFVLWVATQGKGQGDRRP